VTDAANKPRRRLLRLGLAGGVAALTRALPVAAQEEQEQQEQGSVPAYTAAERIHRAHPLEFRLDSTYQPDLTPEAARVLRGAVRDFLYDVHRPGMTLAFWGRHPREIAGLDRHLGRVVAAVFDGIRASAPLRPVDPILVLALLYNESRFQPTVVSPSGAAGMAQFMPDTALQYGLSPVARPDLWQRMRDLEAADARERERAITALRERFGVRQVSADAVIERAVELGSVEVLAAYRRLQELPSGADAARADYVAVLRGLFDERGFFADGGAALAQIDGRVSYRSVSRAVDYMARQLDAWQGMATTAVAAYNAGPGAVRVSNPDSVLYRFGDLPPYPETVRYVQRILAVYAAIKYRVYQISGA